jgi:hypothetical protein
MIFTEVTHHDFHGSDGDATTLSNLSRTQQHHLHLQHTLHWVDLACFGISETKIATSERLKQRD